MEVKITIETNSIELHERVQQFFTKNYQKLADYANYHQHAAKSNIDIYKLLMEVHVKTSCIKQKELAKLVFSKDSQQLHFHILRQIKSIIYPNDN